MADIDLQRHIGRPTSKGVVTVERATVTNFAAAVLDRNPVYRNRDAALAAGFDDIRLPPTTSRPPSPRAAGRRSSHLTRRGVPTPWPRSWAGSWPGAA